MEKIFEQGLLYDFYGELLTEHQQKIYEDAVYNDLSLGEIAAEAGISRQGVHDLIKRCDKILADYEAKLHLVERFAEARKTVNEMLKKADEMQKKNPSDTFIKDIEEIKQLGKELLEKL
ncbi:MAG: YlxM family DNA-binding protein [Lachnospiraceae bacterium]|nr:YlxM family DNA-binding protein [Lachnospiraceae bacterium]